MIASEAQRRALLAGIMDTDGTVGDHQIAVTMVNAPLMEDVLSLVRSLGYKATFREFRAALDGRDAGPMWRIQMTSRQEVSPFAVARKAAGVMDRHPTRTRAHFNAIVRVRKVESRPTRCITVAHESSLYCAGSGFVPTHNTCSEHFLRLKALIEGSPELMDQVKIIRTGSGDQGIELLSGERIRFLARSRSAVRGFSADAVYFDEAFELPVETVGSVLPALSARPNPQVWYTSSAPHFGSEFLHSLLKRAESDDPGSLFLQAWESPPDTRPDDVEAWRRANPALGIRIDEEFVRNEMRTLCGTPQGVAEFNRERLGIREGGDGESGVIPWPTWQKLVIEPPHRMDGVTYGLAVAADSSYASVGSAGRLPNGHLYIDNVEFRPGTDWVLAYLAEDLYPRKKLPIRIDPGGPEGWFLRPLRDAGVEVVEVGGREYQQACGEVLTAVVDGRLHHIGQEPLDQAVAAAGRRDIGKEGGWVFARPGVVDISPLKAATLAVSGVEKKRRPRIHVLNGDDA